MILDNNKFYIKKGNNFPLIKYFISEEVMIKYNISKEMLNNIAVTFSMIDANSGNYVVANEAGEMIILNEYRNPHNNEYCLVYQLNVDDTQEVGRYEGEFIVDFLGDYEYKMTFPINKKIEIIITDSITNTTVI